MACVDGIICVQVYPGELRGEKSVRRVSVGSEVCMVWDVGMPFKGRIVHLMCDSGIEGLLYVEVLVEYAM